MQVKTLLSWQYTWSIAVAALLFAILVMTCASCHSSSVGREDWEPLPDAGPPVIFPSLLCHRSATGGS
jgi:hypothetical protein